MKVEVEITQQVRGGGVHGVVEYIVDIDHPELPDSYSSDGSSLAEAFGSAMECLLFDLSEKNDR